MRHRTFGSTGLEVSEVCFGTMRFAATERHDDERSRAGKRALEEALDQGFARPASWVWTNRGAGAFRSARAPGSRPA